MDPTGTYRLVSKSKVKNGEIHGYTGEIRIILLDSASIAISLYVNKGYPSYNSGSIVDTLLYSYDKAVYKTMTDTSCKITIRFSFKGLNLDEEAEDYNFGCGFGHGVVATGFYRKVSSKIPVIEDLSKE